MDFADRTPESFGLLPVLCSIKGLLRFPVVHPKNWTTG
jgi:hypothetical protein